MANGSSTLRRRHRRLYRSSPCQRRGRGGGRIRVSRQPRPPIWVPLIVFQAGLLRILWIREQHMWISVTTYSSAPPRWLPWIGLRRASQRLSIAPA